MIDKINLHNILTDLDELTHTAGVIFDYKVAGREIPNELWIKLGYLANRARRTHDDAAQQMVD